MLTLKVKNYPAELKGTKIVLLGWSEGLTGSSGLLGCFVRATQTDPQVVSSLNENFSVFLHHFNESKVLSQTPHLAIKKHTDR